MSSGGCTAPGLSVADIMAQTDVVIEGCGVPGSISVSFEDELVPINCTSQFTERSVVRTYEFVNSQTGEIFSICPQEIVYQIDACQPLTSFGVIGVEGATSVNVPSGCDLPTISVQEEEQGGCGFVEYMWLVSTESDPAGNPIIPRDENLGTTWLIIEGENDPTLNPGVITDDTHYVRCARNFSCCGFGESNIVSFRLDNAATCPVDTADGVQTIVDCANPVILSSPANDFFGAEQMMFVTDKEATISNRTGNGANITIDAKLGVLGNPGLEMHRGAAFEIYVEGCKED